MTKKAQKIVDKYNRWVEQDFIFKAWQSEDYEDEMVYENLNGDIIVIQRDANGNIIDAYEN